MSVNYAQKSAFLRKAQKLVQFFFLVHSALLKWKGKEVGMNRDSVIGLFCISSPESFYSHALNRFSSEMIAPETQKG